MVVVRRTGLGWEFLLERHIVQAMLRREEVYDDEHFFLRSQI